MNTKGLKIGSTIAHTGNDYESFGKIFIATITHFEGLAIWVKTGTGERYCINTWDLCEMPQETGLTEKQILTN